ncbi:MAG: hypothetical protein ACN6OC_11650 [Alcaligenes sp.]
MDHARTSFNAFQGFSRAAEPSLHAVRPGRRPAALSRLFSLLLLASGCRA